MTPTLPSMSSRKSLRKERRNSPSESICHILLICCSKQKAWCQSMQNQKPSRKRVEKSNSTKRNNILLTCFSLLIKPTSTRFLFLRNKWHLGNGRERFQLFTLLGKLKRFEDYFFGGNNEAQPEVDRETTEQRAGNFVCVYLLIIQIQLTSNQDTRSHIVATEKLLPRNS